MELPSTITMHFQVSQAVELTRPFSRPSPLVKKRLLLIAWFSSGETLPVPHSTRIGSVALSKEHISREVFTTRLPWLSSLRLSSQTSPLCRGGPMLAWPTSRPACMLITRRNWIPTCKTSYSLLSPMPPTSLLPNLWALPISMVASSGTLIFSPPWTTALKHTMHQMWSLMLCWPQRRPFRLLMQLISPQFRFSGDTLRWHLITLPWTVSWELNLPTLISSGATLSLLAKICPKTKFPL